MKQIFILRHAKSSWDNRELADFDRPLSMRGENDAKTLNTFVKKKSFIVFINENNKFNDGKKLRVSRYIFKPDSSLFSYL